MPTALRYDLYVLAAALLSAAAWIFTETIISFYQVDAIVAAFGGNLMGGVILLLASTRGPLNFNPREWGALVIAAAAIYLFGFLLSFYAIRHIGAGKGALLGRLETIFIVGLAIIFLNERLTARRWMAGGLAIGGTLLINFRPDAFALNFGWGEIAAVLAPLAVAAGIVIISPLLNKGNTNRITGLALVVGALFYIPLLFTVVSSFTLPWVAGGLIVLMGAFRGAAWLFYYLAMRQIGATRPAIIFITSGFFTLMLQVIVARLLPDLGLLVPANLLLAVLGGGLVAVGIVILQVDK